MDGFVSCVVCAWRATCQIRFGRPPEFALHCPEFTRDVTLPAEPAGPGTSKPGAPAPSQGPPPEGGRR